MKTDKILKLGNPKLYEVSERIDHSELEEVKGVAKELDYIILEYRSIHGTGRAIAAPQIGYMKRLICMHIDEPKVLINPELYDKSNELIEIWDDCMSFPGLLVRVRRHKSCRIKFLDLNWQEQEWFVEDDLSELLQHEYDHLNGILATQRVIDGQGFALLSELNKIKK
jgi:peptide deformylase